MGIWLVLGVFGLVLLAGIASGTAYLRRQRRAAGLLCLSLTPLLMFGWYKLAETDRVASWIFPHDTAFASRFSEAEFEQLPTSSDRGSVVQTLGDPLETRVAAGREYWYYSRAGTRYQNYWNYVVILDASTGRVVEKYREFYID